MEKLFTIESMRDMENASPSQSYEARDFKDESESRDSLNPRDWSSTRKTLLFISLMTSSLLADGYAHLVHNFPLRHENLNSD
jgi:hypothetical protein